MLLTELACDPGTFESATGWTLKPEGACKGDACVPLDHQGFDLAATCDKLGMAVVHAPDMGMWAVGPDTVGGRSLTSAQAPDLRLPDLDGNPFSLSSLRGTKVAIVSWAPW
jgi:hypothetical protein